MAWVSSLFVNAAVHILLVPFLGAVVRYRACYSPKAAAADGNRDEDRGVQLNGFFSTIWKTHRLEGWAGLYKGSVPILLQTILIRGSLMLAKIHPAIPLALIAAPQLGFFEGIAFIFFSAIIELPMVLFTMRAIVTPYKLSFRPITAFKALLSPSERRHPWIIYLSPGLFTAIALKTAIPLMILHLVFDLASQFPSEFLPLFAAAIMLYITSFIGCTVMLTPLDVIITRLAIQRNRDLDLEYIPLPHASDLLEGDDYDGMQRYSDEDDVLL
uniref:Putative mitochondrial carrier n=1 Tax=Moniliophthora roreri TaxID=221103 RepID=A0A0W0G631_MONRR